jgi:hypothetical protein
VIQASHPVAFLPSEDLHRSDRFFREVLDLPWATRSPYAPAFDVDGALLRVTKVEGLRPQPFTVFGWQVLDIRSEIERLRDGGILMLRYEGLVQDDAGIWTTGNGDLVARFHDPDSNVLSLTQLVTA